jgi:hypothetical protein
MRSCLKLALKQTLVLWSQTWGVWLGVWSHCKSKDS